MKSLITQISTVILIGLLSTSCTNRQVNTVSGGVIGGVAGNVLTGGSTVGTVAGAAGGALIGSQIR